MFSRAHQYGFINAKLRARISSMLTPDDLKRLADARTLHDLFILLRQTPYRVVEEAYTRTGSLRAGERELLKSQVRTLRDLEDHLNDTDRDILASLLIGYEVECVKNALRLFFSRLVLARGDGRLPAYLYDEAIVHDIDYRRVAASESIDELARNLIGTPYQAIVNRHRGGFQREGTLFAVELDLDRYYYERLIETSKDLPKRDRKITRRLVGVEIDLLNISWIIRYRTYYDFPEEKLLGLTLPWGLNTNDEFIRRAILSQNVKQIIEGSIRDTYPGLSTLLAAPAADTRSRLLLIEQVLEHILLYEVRKILAGYPFTIGIILAYFIRLRYEYRHIKALIIAKQLDLPRERIGEFL